MRKAKEVYIRFGVQDIVMSKAVYEKEGFDDESFEPYIVGWEDEDGEECDEDGVYLNQDEDE